MKEARLRSTILRIKQGDITAEHVDAIVNAANSRLAGGGGVDGAIHRTGGPAIMQECDRIRAKSGGCPTGQAVRTTAGKLHAKAVIHAVGPVWDEQDPQASDKLLASAYQQSLALVREAKLRSVAFPAISTGVYGFPVERAANVVLSALNQFVTQFPDAIDEIRLVLYSDKDRRTYEAALESFLKENA